MVKDSFVFRKDWYIALKNLGDTARLEVYDAIMREVFEDGNSELSLEAKVAMMFITPLIRKDIEKYNQVCERRKLAGSQGGIAKGSKSKQMVANGSKYKQKVASVADNDNDNDIQGTNVPMSKEEDSNECKKKEPVSELEKQFETFRLKYKSYGGKVRGFQSELDDFKKKHKDWKEVIPMLSFAIEKEEQERSAATRRGDFFSQIKNLKTYLNQRSWECYIDGFEKFNPNEYHPQDMVYDSDFNAYRFYGLQPEGYVYDGYDDDNRPDGARVVSQCFVWEWRKNLKKWEQVK